MAVELSDKGLLEVFVRKALRAVLVCVLLAGLSGGASGQSDGKASIALPRGTILPVRLNTSLSSVKSRPGEGVTGKIAQEVPLPSGQKIPRGSKVTGTVIAVTPGASARNAEISLRFDKLWIGHQATLLTTNLRAIAGFVAIEDTQIPAGLSSGEGEVYRWLPTTQIGGDSVFGRGGGTVTKGNDPSAVLGKSTEDGVLVRVTAREGTNCRGELDGNTAPQAMWVFSSDACGVYGLAHLEIAHAGREDPTGLIVLRSSAGKLSLPSGTGMLLRVEDAGR